MAQILDQYGRPIRAGALKEPQTAKLASLRSEFAEHPSRGLTPAKIARILAEAEQGDFAAQIDLADDVEEKSGHIGAELSKRRRALLTLEWDIHPPRNADAAEKKQAAAVKEMLQDVPNLEDVILDMADGVMKGYACLEIEWQMLGKEWLPKKIEHRPQRWFVADRATRSELRLRAPGALDGEALQPFGWVVHHHKAKPGYLSRAGLLRQLVWPFIFAAYGVRDFAEMLEIYGIPMRLGKYQPGASDDEKATLLAAVTNIGHVAAGIIPEGMAIEFQKAAEGGQAPFVAMLDWAERTESKVILGQTTSSEAKATGLGSGVADAHADVRHDLLVSDARQVGATLSRDLVYPLIALNLGGVQDQRRAPMLRFDTRDAEDLAAYANALPKLVAIGVKVPEPWARERLQIPDAKEGEELLRGAVAPTVGDEEADRESDQEGSKGAANGGKKPPEKGPAHRDAGEKPGAEQLDAPKQKKAAARDRPAIDLPAPRVELAAEEREEQEALDAVAGEIAPETLSSVAEPIVAPLMEMIRAGETPEQMLGALAEAYPDLDTARLEELLARAFFAASVYGRLAAGGDA